MLPPICKRHTHTHTHTAAAAAAAAAAVAAKEGFASARGQAKRRPGESPSLKRRLEPGTGVCMAAGGSHGPLFDRVLNGIQPAKKWSNNGRMAGTGPSACVRARRAIAAASAHAHA